MALQRKLRRELNDAVLEVVELDLSKETTKSIEEKIHRVVCTLDRNGVSGESNYRTKIASFRKIAKEYFENGKVKVISESPFKIDPDKRRVYNGFIEPFTFKVTIDPHEYFLERFPARTQPKTNLRWGFNHIGRLKGLDYKISRNCGKLVSVTQTYRTSDEWQESEMWVFPIPQEVLKLKPIFRNAEIYAVYQTMIEWGHISCRNLLEQVNLGKIEYLPCKREEIPLVEITNDNNGLEMISAAANIFPHVKANKSGKYTLRYEPFKIR